MIQTKELQQLLKSCDLDLFWKYVVSCDKNVDECEWRRLFPGDQTIVNYKEQRNITSFYNEKDRIYYNINTESIPFLLEGLRKFLKLKVFL